MMLALMLILLLPVSGWAEVVITHEYPVLQGQPVVHCRTFRDKDLGYVMEGPGCQKHLMPACYQRMQEGPPCLNDRATVRGVLGVDLNAGKVYAAGLSSDQNQGFVFIGQR